MSHTKVVKKEEKEEDTDFQHPQTVIQSFGFSLVTHLIKNIKVYF